MSKVLVIEDQKDLYSMFDLILQFHGFEVTVVDDGRKAMEILKDGTPLDFEIRGVNALQKPVLSMDLLVDRVREIAEQKVPALK